MKVLLSILLILCFAQCTIRDSGKVKSFDDVDIYYKIKGHGDLNLIFIPGWSQTSESWDNQYAYFSEKYKVITLDLPGFGQSGKNREQWTMENYGLDVITLIKKLDLENVVLIGHSMGGVVALSAASREMSTIKGLVLVDIVNDTENYRTDSWVENLIASWKVKIRKGNLADLNGFFLKPELAQRYSEMLPEEIPVFWWDMLRNLFTWRNDEMKPALNRVKCPIILINSDSEITDVESIGKYADDLYVHIIPETSHSLFWDKPNMFNEVLLKVVESKFQSD
ncbi:alpha/beta fold hydrolase [Robiginitalea sp. SC105]|uniref:alpha/beta fold hydrolase n=1 Tax=Robiginitalea sp. SC105 TaxID=2762332 RepID=UPI00163B2A28|nr:alpha/beta hydrolase [Robiginitalea sp. SC105]MBC2839862.1 alpha/beta hydrolase [Robiginitalea sp. SC105]